MEIEGLEDFGIPLKRNDLDNIEISKKKKVVQIDAEHLFNGEKKIIEIRHKLKWKFPIVLGAMIFGITAFYIFHVVLGPYTIERPSKKPVKHKVDQYG